MQEGQKGNLALQSWFQMKEERKNLTHSRICNHKASPHVGVHHKFTLPVWSEPQVEDVLKSGLKPCEYTEKPLNYTLKKCELYSM